MSPASPIQGLLWRIWQQARWKLLTQQVLLLAVLLLIYSIPTDEYIPLAKENQVTRTIVLASVFLLWVSCMPNLIRMGRQWSSAGFPHTHDFILPVATWKLVLTPLLLWTALFIMAYVLPTLLLHWLAGTQPPLWAGGILIAEYFIVVTALNWGKPIRPFGELAGLTVAVLYWRGHLIPEFITDESTGELIVASPTELLVPTILTLAVIAATVIGVTKQRHGETTDRSPEKNESSWFRLPSPGFLRKPCPVRSPLAAELWLVREQKGFFKHLVSGLGLGIGVLLLLALGEMWSPEDDPATRAEVLLATSGILLLAVAAVTTTAIFGITYSNEAPQLGVFLRTRPLASFKLLYTRFAVAYLGLLLAIAGVWLAVELFGALFLLDFDAVRAELRETTVSWFDQPVAELLRQTLRTGIILMFAMLLLSSARAGFTLLGRKLAWPLAVLPIYLPCAFLITYLVAGPELIAVAFLYFLLQHLWIFVIGLPLAILYFTRELLRDNVISMKHFTLLCVAGLLCYLITNTPITFPGDTPARMLVIRSVGTVDGLIPLFAITLTLWTMHRFRHA